MWTDRRREKTLGSWRARYPPSSGSERVSLKVVGPRSRRRGSPAAGSEDHGLAAPVGILLRRRDCDEEPAVTPDPSQQEEAANRRILNHLISRYGELLAEEDIGRTFEECVAQFSSARIREFVPVLAHRRADTKLRAMASDRERLAKVRMTELLELDIRSEVSVQREKGEQA